MARQGWTTQVAAAAAVAAGAGAAQLGIGYGLGIVLWPAYPTTGDAVWLGSLGWAVWIAAGSTVIGAVTAARISASPQVRIGSLARTVLALAAAVGALLTVALVGMPARAAVRADTFSPQSIAAGYALLGVFLGIVVAYWAAGSRPIAANVLVTSAWLWLLAIVAVATGLRAELPATGVQLGHWRMTGLANHFYYGTVYWPGALLAIVAALLIGALAAWPTVRRGDRGIGAAASGAVGPLLVALAYFTLAPQLTGARGMLESAYLITPYTVLAGLAGSALLVAWGEKAAHRRAVRRQQASRAAARTEPPTPAAEAAPRAAEATLRATDRPAVGWLEPNGGAARRPDPTPVTVDSVFDDEPSVWPAPTGGRAKLPTPRTESTPPPRSTPASPPTVTKQPRSTVTPPPDSPTVAIINPSRPPADRPPADRPPADRLSTPPEPSVSPTPQQSSPPAQTPPAKAPSAKPAAASPAKAAPAKSAAKSTPSSRRPSRATKATPTANPKSVDPTKGGATTDGSTGDTSTAGSDTSKAGGTAKERSFDPDTEPPA